MGVYFYWRTQNNNYIAKIGEQILFDCPTNMLPKKIVIGYVFFRYVFFQEIEKIFLVSDLAEIFRVAASRKDECRDTLIDPLAQTV